MNDLTSKLLMQYEFVRRTGRTNMLDINAVGAIATSHGLLTLAHACLDKKEYSFILANYKDPGDEAFSQWCADNDLEEPS